MDEGDCNVVVERTKNPMSAGFNPVNDNWESFSTSLIRDTLIDNPEVVRVSSQRVTHAGESIYLPVWMRT